MQPTVLGIGAAFVDTIFFVEDHFLDDFAIEKGSVAPIDLKNLHHLVNKIEGPVVQAPGGSCANVIRALSKMGWKCSLTGKIGTDASADYLLQNLKDNKIRSYYIPTNLPTGRVLCFVTPDAERTMRDLLGASAAMQGSDLIPEEFQKQSLVHIEGYTLFNANLAEKAMESASQAGALVSFDLANFKIVQQHRRTLNTLIDKYVDILFSNAQEAEELTGLDPEEACKKLCKKCTYAVVTMSAQGCWVGHKDEIVHVPAVRVKNVIDTTGAGDLFSAGFLDGIFRGKSLEESARQGAYLAAQVIGVQGAYLGPEKWGEILSGLGMGL